MGGSLNEEAYSTRRTPKKKRFIPRLSYVATNSGEEEDSAKACGRECHQDCPSLEARTSRALRIQGNSWTSFRECAWLTDYPAIDFSSITTLPGQHRRNLVGPVVAGARHRRANLEELV